MAQFTSKILLDSPWVMIGVGAFSLAMYYPIRVVIERLGLIEPSLLAQAFIFFFMMYLYPERNNSKNPVWLVYILAVIGALIGAAWVLIAPRFNSVKFPDLNSFSKQAIFISYLNAVLVAPLFEEKVARALLFGGMKAKAGNLLSTIVVSVIFGLAHTDNVIFAFLVSVVLCVMSFKYGLNTFYRAITHGVVNATILTWYFTKGFCVNLMVW